MYILLPKKSLQTNLTKEKSLQTVLTKLLSIIPNNTYKLSPQKLFQTILTNYYHRNNCKLCLQKFIRYFNLLYIIHSLTCLPFTKGGG